jgi:hypothetical protein
MPEYPFFMKTLQFQRDENKDRVTVTCSEGDKSVYSHCAYCRHCRGVRVGNRQVQTPQSQVLVEVRRGKAADESLMNAAMIFNTLVRDGTALECDDDKNTGFVGLY